MKFIGINHSSWYKLLKERQIELQDCLIYLADGVNEGCNEIASPGRRVVNREINIPNINIARIRERGEALFFVPSDARNLKLTFTTVERV